MPEAIDPAIPQELSERLEGLRPFLQQQGTILTSGERCRLRYRAEQDGRLVHRSVELDGPEVASAVTAKLTNWREQYEAQQQAERAKAAEALMKVREEALEWRRYEQIASMSVALRGGNRKCQRSAVKTVRLAAAGDRMALMTFMTSGLPATRGRPGRPRRGQLY
jgi:hypothetical protein